MTSYLEKPNAQKLQALQHLSFEQFKKLGLSKSSSTNDEQRKIDFKVMKTYVSGHLKSKTGITHFYTFTEQSNGEGRQYCGGSIQGLNKIVRGFLFGDCTTDIDMVNAHPTILLYLCKQHSIPCPNLEYYVRNRDEVLARFDNRDEAKTALLKSLNDSKPTRHTDKFIRDFDKECKFIQQQITALAKYSDIVRTVPSNKQLNWLGSAINRIMCVYENRILMKVMEFLVLNNLEILAPMFDGCMVYGNVYDNRGLLSDLEMCIEQEFPGLRMKFAYKPHKTGVIPEDGIVGCDDNDKKTICDSNDAAAQVILSRLEGRICSYNGRILMKDGNKWISDSEQINNTLLNFVLKSEIYSGFDEKKNKYIPYVQNYPVANNIVKVIKSDVIQNYCNDKIYALSHSSTHNCICFEDGVLDFEKRTFTEWDDLEEPIFTTVIIPRCFGPYFKNPDESKIADVKTKIYESLYGSDCERALHFLSRAITGNNADKNWGTFVGNRDCGKGIQYENLKCAFGDYVATFDIANITHCRNTLTRPDAKSFYWLLDLEYVRLAISQETPPADRGIKYNGELIKKITGGKDTLIARRCYDRFDTHFTTDMTPFCMGNNSVDCDTKDVLEHCVSFITRTQYKSQEYINDQRRLQGEYFNESLYRLADPTLKPSCATEEIMNATVMLLFNSWKNTPVSVIIEEDELADINLSAMIHAHYDITLNPDNMVLPEDIMTTIGMEDKKKLKLELQGLLGCMGEKVWYKKCKSKMYKDKWVYCGIKAKLIEENEEES